MSEVVTLVSNGILNYLNRTNPHNNEVVGNTPEIIFIDRKYPVRYQIRQNLSRRYMVQQQYLMGYNATDKGQCVGQQCGVDGWVDCAGTNHDCMIISLLAMTTIIEEQKELLNQHLFNCAEAENKALTLATKLLTL